MNIPIPTKIDCLSQNGTIGVEPWLQTHLSPPQKHRTLSNRLLWHPVQVSMWFVDSQKPRALSASGSSRLLDRNMYVPLFPYGWQLRMNLASMYVIILACSWNLYGSQTICSEHPQHGWTKCSSCQLKVDRNNFRVRSCCSWPVRGLGKRQWLAQRAETSVGKGDPRWSNCFKL